MRLRLRYVMPAVQMAVAIGLYRWDDYWLAAMYRVSRHESYMGPSPGLTILTSLSAPVVLVRVLCDRLVFLWYRYPHHDSEWWMLSFPELVKRAILIVTIGVLWYWVVRNFESWQRMRALYISSRFALRLLSDMFLIAIGLVCGLLALREYLYLRMPLSLSWWHWLSCLFSAMWAGALIYLMGRDFIRTVRVRIARGAS